MNVTYAYTFAFSNRRVSTTAMAVVLIATFTIPTKAIAAGFFVNGEDLDDTAGKSVSGIGDMNGDGLDDFIVGAYRRQPGGGIGPGGAYVVFGTASTDDINLSSVVSGTGGFFIAGIDAGDSCGISVSGAGDVNGDGTPDVIVGSSEADPDGRDGAGESYVVFGKSTTTAVNLSDVVAGTGGFVINGITANGANGDWSGFSVSGAGDVNGDGLHDVIVGAYKVDGLTGQSYVVFGKATTAAVELTDVVAGTGGFAINGIDPGDLAGYNVSGAGDVNGDGKSDVIVGAPDADIFTSGDAYVIFGKTSTTAVELSDIEAGIGGFNINGAQVQENFGLSVSGAGDVNGDGLADVIVGAPSEDSPGSGAAFVVFGRTATTTIQSSDIASGIGGFVMNGENDADFCGRSVASAGDVNGDGLDDVMVGGNAGLFTTRVGHSYVVYGKTSTTAVNLADVAADIGGFRRSGGQWFEFFGWDVAGVGDVNGDGLDDVLTAIPNGGGAGQCFLDFSPVVLPSPLVVWVDFAYIGTESGTFPAPFNTLNEGLLVVSDPGTIKVKGNSSDTASNEILLVNQGVSIQAIGGTISIGHSGARRFAFSKTGFIKPN